MGLAAEEEDVLYPPRIKAEGPTRFVELHIDLPCIFSSNLHLRITFLVHKVRAAPAIGYKYCHILDELAT